MLIKNIFYSDDSYHYLFRKDVEYLLISPDNMLGEEQIEFDIEQIIKLEKTLKRYFWNYKKKKHIDYYGNDYKFVCDWYNEEFYLEQTKGNKEKRKSNRYYFSSDEFDSLRVMLNEIADYYTSNEIK